MTRQNIIEKCEGTTIGWKEGKDVTMKKIKKKNKKKNAAQKTITKMVEQESFFNFFKTIQMPEEKELTEGKKGEEDEEEKDVGELMDQDFETGNDFKDQLIPLALEYYMEVIEDDEEEGEGCDSCEEGEHGAHKHDKDSDEEEEKPKGKGKKKGGKEGAEKQQECKQQ